MKKTALLVLALQVFLGTFPLMSADDAVEVKKSETPSVKTEEIKVSSKKDDSAVLRYENSEKNYSIDHPKGWQRKEMAKLDLVLFAPGKDGSSDPVASMNIVSEKVEEKVTLNEFYTESINNLKTALKDVKVEKEGEKLLNGAPSKWILYTHEMQGIKFSVLQYFIVSNDTVYLLTFSAPANTFADFRDNFENIASTFQLKQPAAAKE